MMKVNKLDFLKILLPVTELHGRRLSDGALELYFEDVEFLEAQQFKALLKKHRGSSQGKYWPTFSHIVDLAGTEDDAGAKAGIDFDKNSAIDGTGDFDINAEDHIKKATRRKRWVDRKKLEWKNTDPQVKLNNPLALPQLSQTNLGIEQS